MGQGVGVHGLQIVVLLLLTLVAGFALLARWLRIPYPIVLVLAGLGVSFLPHIPRIPLTPNLVFLIFLPPLLYVSAWQTSWRDFKRNFVTISMLAIGLVAFTVWAVAEIAPRFMPTLDWRSGFVLGAVVAATDAIAATSIAQSVGLPKRIVEVLEGESLVNDATALLALEFGTALIVHGQTPGVTSSLVRFLWLIAGGIGAGLLLAQIVAWVEQRVNDGQVEILISLIVPYVAYAAGEEVRASGVLSVVACGLFLSRRSARFYRPEVRLQITGFWNALNFGLNGIVFLMIGLQLPYVLAGIHAYSRWTLIWDGLAFSAVLILLRLAWVFPVQAMAHWVRNHLLGQQTGPLPVRGVFVVGWTGMRGVLALAAAFSLPEKLANGQPFTQRNLIIFLAFGVILVTLVLQGLTLPPLIRLLGLSGAGKGDPEERHAKSVMLKAAIQHLQEVRTGAGDRVQHGYDDLLHRYEHRLAAVEDDGRRAKKGQLDARTYRSLRKVALETVEVERQTMIRLRDEGKIGDDTMRRLEREIDLVESRDVIGQDR